MFCKKAGQMKHPSMDLIMGIKEVPKEELLPQKSYLFFSHVIKGQPYNMPVCDALVWCCKCLQKWLTTPNVDKNEWKWPKFASQKQEETRPKWPTIPNEVLQIFTTQVIAPLGCANN